MTPRLACVAFGLTTIALYIVFTLPLAVMSAAAPLMLLVVPYLFGSLGLALDVGELILAAFLPPRRYAAVPHVDLARTRVAVLYTCRDDVDREALEKLRELRAVDVFVLDDSEQVASRALLDASGLQVVRRARREGFKAGNLNHWLRAFGDAYAYCLVLDSDSIVTSDALAQLVAYAEHPTNRHVAIVQALILPRAGNRFQTRIGAFAALRWFVLLRVHEWIGWSLSQGHNNLHRVSALNEIGGFDTAASCEDTLTSLRLRGFGWRTILVDTVTFDAEPRNVFAHRRRTVRWARQTLDAILARRGGVHPALGLLLARHLHSYLRPLLWPFMLAPVAMVSIGQYRCCASLPPLAPTWFKVAEWLAFVCVLLLPTLRLWFWCRTTGTYRGFFASSALSGVVATFSSVQISCGLVRSVTHGSTAFVPTGIERADEVKLISFWRAMKVASVASGIAALVLARSGDASAALTLIYIVGFISMPPLVLWWSHRDQRSLGDEPDPEVRR